MRALDPFEDAGVAEHIAGLGGGGGLNRLHADRAEGAGGRGRGAHGENGKMRGGGYWGVVTVGFGGVGERGIGLEAWGGVGSRERDGVFGCWVRRCRRNWRFGR